MGLTDSLSIALSGIQAVQYGMSTASQNIANQSTSGYIREVSNVESLSFNGSGGGVKKAITTLANNSQIQTALYYQNSEVSRCQTINDALAPIISLQGSTSADPGSSGTLSDILGNLQSSFTALTATPSNPTSQSTVLLHANSFVRSINNISNTIQTQKENSEYSISLSVKNINRALNDIGSLSDKIMFLKNQDQDTADIENQRFTAINALSNEISIRWKESSNGDITLSTINGTNLPTHNKNDKIPDLSVEQYPLKIQENNSSIFLSNTDIKSELKGGILGANISLRDYFFPKMQAQVDSLSYSVANRFNSAGLRLFTDANGNIPGSADNNGLPDNFVGFGKKITVSDKYMNTPSLLVSENKPVDNFLQNVLSTAFGSLPKNSSLNLPFSSSNLGNEGDLLTGYDNNQDIISLATSLTAQQAMTANSINTDLKSSQLTQTNLSKSMDSLSKVSINNEIANVSTLQNSYSANAKVISIVQNMFSSLLNSIGN